MPAPFNAATWLVDRHVESGHGDGVALLCGDGATTYGRLLTLVEGAAAGLRGLGVRPDERVALVLRDSIELATGILAAMRIGAVAVPLNPLLPAVDLAGIVADARARTAVVQANAPALITALREHAPDVTSVVTVGPDAGDPPMQRAMGWEELTAAGGDGSPWSTSDESPGFWLCTSGTTGRPKLAMHRHADMRTTAEGYAREVLAVEPADIHLSAAPLFHAYGLGNSLTFPLAAGACAVLEPTRPPTPALVADLVRRHQPTLFFAVPTFYAALLAANLPGDAFAGVRQAVSAGEALPAELFTRFQERFGVEILDGIGSTEMTHIFISNRHGSAVPGTSGTPVVGHRVKLLDDAGAEAGEGEPGQLHVAGDAAALGYWCRTAETRATFAGDWVRTGDVYSRDAQGFYRHLGRRDDMLRVGAEWVSPGEVEDVLLAHPAVAEAAVVGAGDADGLTRAVAFVVARAGETVDAPALLEHCRGRLAGYKRPRRAVLVDLLPKTATGKVVRVELRQRAAEILAEGALDQVSAVSPRAS
jgi:benzoate-CoA ligase family protein